MKDRPGKLSLKPQQVSNELWYYEEPAGLVIVSGGVTLPTIPWKMLEASLARYHAYKQAHPRKKKQP
jgi:hypothetical protein